MQTLVTKYRRDAKRYTGNFRAILLVGDRRVGCTILDLSRLGAKLDLPRPVAPKTDVALIVDGIGLLDGFVVWYKEPVAGIAFRPRSPDVAARLHEVLQRLKAGELHRRLGSTHAQFGRRART